MALITSFTVDGVEVATTRLRDQSITFDKQINGRSVLECTLVDRTLYPASPYIPTVRDTVLLEIDGTPVFGGILWAQRTGNIAGPGRGVKTEATFTDYKALLDRVYFNAPIPAGSLASQLVPLITNMSAHGITLSGSQEDGPAMGAQFFDFKTIRECLDALSAQTVLTGATWIYTISPTGVFRMYEAGTQAAPFTLTESVGNYRSASWAVDLNSYVNNIYTLYGPSGQALITQTLTGDNVTTTFLLSHPLVISSTGVSPAGYVTVTRIGPAVTLENIDAEPVTGPAMWHYDAATNTLIQDDSGVVLLTGETVSITYYVVGPFTLFDGDDEEYGDFGPFTDVITMPEVTDTAIAQTALEAELERRLGLQKRLTVLTDEAGAEPFQTIVCTMPSLGVSGDYLITEVSLVEVTVNTNGGSGRRDFAFELQCIEGNRYRGNWELFWRPETTTPGSATVAYEAFNGCPSTHPLLFQSDWDSNTVVDTFDSLTGTNAETAAVGVNNSSAVRRIDPDDVALTGPIVLDKTVAEVLEGCVEFRFKSDGGISDTQVFGFSQAGTFGLDTAQVSFVRTMLPDAETGQLNIRGNGAVTTLFSQAGVFGTTFLDWFRVEFKLGTHIGGGVFSDNAYVRLYKNGLLLHQSTGLTWNAASADPTSGLSAFQFRIQGVQDAVRVRGTVVASASASISPSASLSPSASVSSSPSSSASRSLSPSSSPSSSASPSLGNSPSVSPSASVSPSPSRSVSPSVSPSSSVSPSASVSPTPSPSASVSPSAGAGFAAVKGLETGIQSSDSLTHAATLPANAASGDLVIVFYAIDGDPVVDIDTGTGWSNWGKGQQGTNVCGNIFSKILDGSGDALIASTDQSQQSTHISIAIAAGTFNASNPMSRTYGGQSTGSNTNPPSHNPGLGADDFLWIAARFGDAGTNVPSAPPASYDEMVTRVGGVSGASVTICERELNASTEDPGTFTVGLAFSLAATVAIHPV